MCAAGRGDFYAAAVAMSLKFERGKSLSPEGGMNKDRLPSMLGDWQSIQYVRNWGSPRTLEDNIFLRICSGTVLQHLLVDKLPIPFSYGVVSLRPRLLQRQSSAKGLHRQQANHRQSACRFVKPEQK